MKSNWHQTCTMYCFTCKTQVKEEWYWVKNGKLADIVYFCMCTEEEE